MNNSVVVNFPKKAPPAAPFRIFWVAMLLITLSIVLVGLYSIPNPRIEITRVPQKFDFPAGYRLYQMLEGVNEKSEKYLPKPLSQSRLQKYLFANPTGKIALSSSSGDHKLFIFKAIGDSILIDNRVYATPRGAPMVTFGTSYDWTEACKAFEARSEKDSGYEINFGSSYCTYDFQKGESEYRQHLYSIKYQGFLIFAFCAGLFYWIPFCLGMVFLKGRR